MPWFYFHVNDGKATTVIDDVGRDLPDLATARQEALKDIVDVRQANFAMLPREWTTWSLHICDGDGATLDVLPFLKN